MDQSKLPIKYSYQVTDAFYAGEYPFEKETEEGIVKLKRLTDFGIKHFIDLTSERLTKYSDYLPKHCTYLNLPTIDYTTPSFQDLQTAHDSISQAEDKVFVHCKGGYDRTGVVVATYFIYTGLVADQAKKRYLQVADKIRTRYAHLPLIETRWEVLKDYELFLKQ
jgi:protein-tyrosine phosphatase